MCHFVLVIFSHFSIAITSLGEERANLSAFRTFVRFVLVWICRFPLPLGVWEGLRFVIVALPGLFSYLFCTVDRPRQNFSFSSSSSLCLFARSLVFAILKLRCLVIVLLYVVIYCNSALSGAFEGACSGIVAFLSIRYLFVFFILLVDYLKRDYLRLRTVRSA